MAFSHGGVVSAPCTTCTIPFDRFVSLICISRDWTSGFECIRVKSNHHHYNLMGTQRHQQMHIPQKGNVEILTNHFDFSTLDKYHPPKHWKHPLQGRHLHFLRHFSRYRGHHFAHSTCIRRGVSIVQLGREGEAATLGNRHEIRFIIYGPMCKRTASFCRRTCCFLCGTSS